MGEGLEVDPKKHVDWDDPVNQKVLGSPDWMAEPSKELEAQMAQALKRATRIPDPRIKPLERRSAIEALRPVVDQCYADAKARTPGLIGRVIVTFEASSTDTQGMVQNVRLSTIVKLDADPGFRTCVLSNADGLRFPASEAGESRTVEYPFFYDGSY